MTFGNTLLPEFDQEMGTTRRILALVPEQQADWRPHPKSWCLGDLASHIARLPTWGVMTIARSEFDLGAPGTPPTPPFTTTAALLDFFDENVAALRSAVSDASDADLVAPWTLKNGETTVFSLPRLAVLRSLVLSHMIHHRGQLTVYLRLRDVPLPPVYGPTADSAV